jgi:DNA-binding transcriptional LysR family regulator
MDLRALEIFKAVVEQGGINKAAARLHRVPSNVTTRIKQLEEQLDTKLFARERGNLQLSAQGKILLTYADRLLRLSADAEAALKSGKPRGPLRIGALESTAAARLPSVLSKYHGLYPDVGIELITGTSGALINRLRAREIEAAFVTEPFNGAGLESQFAFIEEIVLVTPKTYRRARSAADIKQLTIIGFANGCSYRRRLEAWLGAEKIHPDRAIEFQSYHAIIACVAAGSGIAVVPRSMVRKMDVARELNVVALPAATARADTQLVWRSADHSAALAAFRKLLPRQTVLKKGTRRQTIGANVRALGTVGPRD